LRRLIASLATILFSLQILTLPASASPTLVSNDLTLGLAGDGQTLIRAGSVNISGGGTMTSKTFACPSAVSARTTLVANSQPMSCVELFNSSGTGAFTGNDLGTAKVQTGQSSFSSYDISRGAHIVTTTFVTVTAVQYHIHPASVQATAPAPSVISQPSVTLTGSQISTTNGIWSSGSSTDTLWLCPSAVSAQTTPSNLGLPASCARLYRNAQGSTPPTDLLTAYVDLVSGRALFATSMGTHVVAQSVNSPLVVYSASVNYGSVGSGPGSVGAAAPVKYSGPEFSGLALKPALAGSSATLEGRKLDQISSVTIGGKAAVLSNATDKSVNIGLPAGLTPGVYDLVVTTANHGKLTHMNAIRIREVLPPASLTIQGTGVLSGEEFKKLTAFSRTQNPDMNTVTCIVNSNSEGKSFMQARALCDRIAATNLNVKTTMFETRSTVKSSAIFARVVFSSEE
jgi:hypothetical protein